MDRYMDIGQAAKRLGVSTKTLRRWVHMQKIPYRMDNRKLFFDVADLEAKRSEESPDRMDNTALLERIEALESHYSAISDRLREIETMVQQKPIPVTPVSRPAPLRPTRLVHNGKDTLPDGLVSFRSFADLHNITQSTAQRAIEYGRLPVIQGKWKRGKAVVQQALDAAGQRRFYELFEANVGFKPCPRCPHDV